MMFATLFAGRWKAASGTAVAPIWIVYACLYVRVSTVEEPSACVTSTIASPQFNVRCTLTSTTQSLRALASSRIYCTTRQRLIVMNHRGGVPRHLASSLPLSHATDSGKEELPRVSVSVVSDAPLSPKVQQIADEIRARNVMTDHVASLVGEASYPSPPRTEVVTSPGGTNGERLPEHFASPSTLRDKLSRSHLTFAGDSSPGGRVYDTHKVEGRELQAPAHVLARASKTKSQWSLADMQPSGAPPVPPTREPRAAQTVSGLSAAAESAPAVGATSEFAARSAAARANRNINTSTHSGLIS